MDGTEVFQWKNSGAASNRQNVGRYGTGPSIKTSRGFRGLWFGDPLRYGVLYAGPPASAPGRVEPTVNDGLNPYAGHRRQAGDGGVRGHCVGAVLQHGRCEPWRLCRVG